MGLFGKNKDVIDLAERYRKQKEREREIKENIETAKSQETSGSPFSFFDSGSSSSQGISDSDSDSDNFMDLSGASMDRRKRLAKRILDMTTKIEDLSNQMYHLQQRLELIEKKLNVNF